MSSASFFPPSSGFHLRDVALDPYQQSPQTLTHPAISTLHVWPDSNKQILFHHRPLGSVYRYLLPPPWVLPPMFFFGPWHIGPFITSTAVPQLFEIHIQQCSFKGISRFGWMMPHQGMPQMMKIWQIPGWLKIRWLQGVVGELRTWILLENQNEQTTLNFKQRNVKVHKHRTFTTYPPFYSTCINWPNWKGYPTLRWAMQLWLHASWKVPQKCCSTNPQPNIFHCHITLSCCHSHPGHHCPPKTKTFPFHVESNHSI